MTVILRVGSMAVLGVTFLLVAGCSSNVAPTPSPSATPSAGTKAAAAPEAARAPTAPRPAAFSTIKAPADKGVILGRVLYQGTPPKAKPISFGGEKLCADFYKGDPPTYETLVVSPQGAVKWALVSIRDKISGNYPAPAKPVVMDQIACVFQPHVVGLIAGQEIEYRNSDPVSHNIRATPKKNPAFNTIFSAKMDSKSKLELAEFGIPLKCDIHFWMSAYVHVLPHPFFAITSDDGAYVISDVPPGEYTLLTWHETLKPQTQKVTVKPGEVSEVDFTFAGN